jgi:cytochrome b
VNDTYRVWDLPIRLFHWALVILIALQWASAEFNLLSMDWHFRIGYAILGLLLFRIAWGFVGSQSARFGQFLAGPRRITAYLPRALLREADADPGHNPLGAWSAIALIGVVLAQAITGLFSSDDIALFGPLAERVDGKVMDWMTDMHELLPDVLIALVVLHLLAVTYHALWKRENLIGAMFSGRKRLPADPQLRFAGAGLAWTIAIAAAGVVWAIVEFGPR